MDIQTLLVYGMLNFKNIEHEKYLKSVMEKKSGNEQALVARSLVKLCDKYDFTIRDCAIYASILFVESSYKLHTINKKTKDYCMAQVNHTHKFSKLRSIMDLDYCLEQGIKVLNYFRLRFKKKEPHWFGRYNCGTRISCVKNPKTKAYIKRVLNKISL